MAQPSHSGAGRHLDRALSSLVWLGTLAALFWPLVRDAALGIPRFFDWDVPEQYWPDLVRLCRDLHGEGVPYWSPHDRGGYPYYADPQAAPYHPVNWAICAAAGPSPSIHWATFRVVLGFLIAAIGAHAWLRHTAVGRRPSDPPHSHAAAALGACVFASAPFLRHNWELNLTFALAWLPWILLAIDSVRALPTSPSRAALLALAIAMCAWTGSPPALWLAATFALGYGAAVFAADGTLPRSLGLTAILALLLVSVVIVPGQALSGRSVQADHTFASLASESLTWDGLRALVRPLPGNHLFLGPAVWLATGAALWSRSSRPAVLGCLGISAVAVLLALGEHGPLFRFFFDVVPGFDRFRLPHRYEAWLGPSAALMSALGLDVLTRELAGTRGPSKLRQLRWALGLSLAGAHLALVTTTLDPERHTRIGELPCRGADDPLRAEIAESADRVFDEFALGCRSGTRLGHEDLRGYQDPLMLHSYERVLARLAERPGLLRQFGVRYALTSPHFLHGWDHHYLPRPEILTSLPGARTVYTEGARRVIDLGEPVPRAYFVSDDEVMHAGSREEALDLVSSLAPRRVAVLETETDVAPGVGRAVVDGLVEDETGARSAIPELTLVGPDRIDVQLESRVAGVLVLNDTFDEGWTATVDGAPREVIRVNALVRGVRVEEGQHAVVFQYAPRDGWSTRAMWALGWGLSLLLLSVPARDRRATR